LIRVEVTRYVQTINTTPHPYTVAGRTKALRGVLRLPRRAPPRGDRLYQIERTRHIEPYLAGARNRPRRGKNGERSRIVLVVCHRDVVDLRRFFEDIPGWGWASAPPRRRLFYAAIPRTPDALSRRRPGADGRRRATVQPVRAHRVAATARHRDARRRTWLLRQSLTGRGRIRPVSGGDFGRRDTR
jgi:hypothetical protein